MPFASTHSCNSPLVDVQLLLLFRLQMIKFWQKKQTKLTPTSSFKNSLSLAERVEKRQSLKQKYPEDKFTVLVVEGLLDLPSTVKHSKPFMLIGLQRNMNVLYLIGYIKKMLKINEGHSIFVDVGGAVVSMTTAIGELGEKHADVDGFVYIRVKTEESF